MSLIGHYEQGLRPGSGYGGHYESLSVCQTQTASIPNIRSIYNGGGSSSILKIHLAWHVCTVCAEEQANECQEITGDVGEDAGHGTADNADHPRVDEAHDSSVAAGDAGCGTPQSGINGDSQTAGADHVETNRCDEESPKQSGNDAVEETVLTATTRAKPAPTSTKAESSSRTTKNATKCADKKIWKPAGSINTTSTQPNRKEAGTSSRGGGNAHRQGNTAAAPARLPPISISAVGSSDRRKQQDTVAGGEMAGRGASKVRAVGANGASPGRLYRCSFAWTTVQKRSFSFTCTGARSPVPVLVHLDDCTGVHSPGRLCRGARSPVQVFIRLDDCTGARSPV